MAEEEKNESGELDDIIKNGSVVTESSSGRIHCLSIIGQVEGHYILPSEQKSTKYEHLIPLLVAIEESTEIQGLLVILNTVGGDVEAGLAIAERFAREGKDVFISARKAEEAESAAEAISAKYGVFSKGYVFDLRDRAAIVETFKDIDSMGYCVETVCHNAANLHLIEYFNDIH